MDLSPIWLIVVPGYGHGQYFAPKDLSVIADTLTDTHIPGLTVTYTWSLTKLE